MSAKYITNAMTQGDAMKCLVFSDKQSNLWIHNMYLFQ